MSVKLLSRHPEMASRITSRAELLSENSQSNEMVSYIFLCSSKKPSVMNTSRLLFGSTATENMTSSTAQEYYISQICESKHNICSRFPQDKTIVKKWEITPWNELELKYARVINKMRHSASITMLCSLEGQVKGTKEDIEKIIINVLDVSMSSSGSNSSSSSSSSSSSNSSSSLALSPSNELDKAKKKTEEEDKYSNCDSNQSDSNTMVRQRSKLSHCMSARNSCIRRVKIPIIKRLSHTDNGTVFPNVDTCLEAMHSNIIQTLGFDSVIASEFVQRVKSDSKEWCCGMCFRKMIEYDPVSGAVKVNDNIGYCTNTTFKPVTTSTNNLLNPSDPSSNQRIYGLLCTVCHNDLVEINKHLHKLPTWDDLLDALPYNTLNNNSLNPIESAYAYTMDKPTHQYFPMDCESDF